MVKTEYFFELKERIREIINETSITSGLDVITDSRLDVNGQAFIAIKGEKFDAFDFIEQVVSKGPKLIICECESEDRIEVIHALAKKSDEVIFIVVDNTVSYMQELATLNRNKWQGQIIGITGSNGKTTTKEMLFYLLDQLYPGQVMATEGNLNNHLGVPFTLFRLEDKYKYAIVEMGTNHPGEIKVLCDIALPDHGFITNIGESHLEFFGSKDNVFVEKSELYHAITKRNLGYFVINNEDEFLKTLDRTSEKIDLFQDSHNFIEEKEGDYVLNLNGETFSLKNSSLTGRHNYFNMAISAFFITLLEPQNKNKILASIKDFRPSLGRSTWIEKSNKKIFSDAYNANPSSMKVSISGFIDELKKNKISSDNALFVIGDMNEMGDLAESLHKDLGAFVKKSQIKEPVFVGRYANYYQDGFLNKSSVFLDKDDLVKNWDKLTADKSYIFLKASRSLQLESLVDIT